MHQPKHKSGYKHDLKNHIYYSEEIKQGNIDIVIRYTLDNYVAVSGTIGGEYVTKAGYLINLKMCNGYSYSVKDVDDKLGEAKLNNFRYQGAKILTEEKLYYYGLNEDGNIAEPINQGKGITSTDAINYYKESIAFSEWFNQYIGQYIKDDEGIKYLSLNNEYEKYDPENEESYFVQHKRKIMKDKIQGILNSSITAYSNKTRNNYKMPVLRAEDWDKIYNNISVISFVQGINLGFKSYNNYCVLNSTNNQEYVNPNLIYFSDNNNYHDVRCGEIKEKNTTGYKIGSFEKQTYETEKKNQDGTTVTDAQGNSVLENKYYYKHNELACYQCINGSIANNETIYNYIRNNSTDEKIKTSYFTALARERYNTTKLLSSYNDVEAAYFTITYKDADGRILESVQVKKGDNLPQIRQIDDINVPAGKQCNKWKLESTGETFIAGTNVEYKVNSKLTFVPYYENIKCTVTFDTDGGSNVASQTINWGEKVKEPPIPNKIGYIFMGWNTENWQQFDFNTSIKSDITLYANWASKEIQIRYSLDGNIIEELTTKANVGSIYKPITNILNGRENYSDKILLGYTYSNGGKVNYNENMTIPDKDELTLNVIYVNNNSIKCEVSQNIEDKTCNKFVHKFYTNTTGIITAQITSENSNGSPTITSSISNGINTSSKNGNTYTINSTEEGSNTISASMTLSKNGVSRSFRDNFIIIVDRTAPVLNSAEYEYDWPRHTILANVTEANLYTVRIGNMQYPAAYSYTDDNIRIIGLTEDDCSKTKIVLEDKAGNKTVNYIKDGKLQK